MCLIKALKSSIGKKAIMAASGLLLLGFVIAHLLGNLLIFLGPDALNAYAKKLSSLGPGLWVMRFGLLGIISAHIITAIKITYENREARPIAYNHKPSLSSSYAARTMMVSGFIVTAYIIYHLLHFTFKVTHPDISHMMTADGHHDVFSMVVLSFQQPLIVGVYIVSMAVLCSHLSHGIASIFQSLGLNREECIPLAKRAAFALSALIFIGYSSIPAAVLFGAITTDVHL